MAPSVKISRRVAAVLLDFLDEGFRGDRAVEELRRALDVRPRKAFVSAPTRKQTKAKKDRAKRQTTKEIRAAVMKRANGWCEACGSALIYSTNAPTLDHMVGRKRAPQSERNCWALGWRCCHARKTDNIPSANHWRHAFIAHASRHSFFAEAAMVRAEMEKKEAKDELSNGASHVG